MNKKEDQDRAVKYIKIRVTEHEREAFKKYCENNKKDMTEVLKRFISICIGD